MTTIINPSFMIASSMQELFRDQQTGLPLRSGTISFWEDENRTQPKAVFMLSGTPGNYTYTALPNPLTLTGIGSMSDGDNNDIVIYYYPYDNEGNPQLYYVQVFNSSGVPQFVRQAWPNAVDFVKDSEDTENYISNGQFRWHNNLPADVINGYAAGQIRQAVTNVAQGGWQFVRPSGSAATDIVTFQRIGSYVTNPTANPRYAFRLQTQSPGSGDSFKYLQKVFFDVNKFASDTQYYTASFTGQSNSASSINVSLIFIKNYGSGGSAQTQTTIATFTIGTSFSQFQIQFIPGDNSGKTIGPNDDDYCALVLAYQTNTVQDISVTDFVMAPNAVNIVQFPTTTDEDFSARSMVLPTGDYNGYDIGLPIVSTLQGLKPDYDWVGRIMPSVNATETYGLLCDGSQYLAAGYQPTGVPNQRLMDNLIVSSYFPRYGTGENFMIAWNPANSVIIKNNTLGSVTAAADGSVPTGFTFSRIHIGDAGYGVTSFAIANAPEAAQPYFVIWNTAFGAVTPVGVGTSGFTITSVLRTGSPLTAQITQIQTIAASGLAGDYFTFDTPTLSAYVWFKVNGSGSDPAPSGRTGILVSLLSTDNAINVAIKIGAALNGVEVTGIVVPTGTVTNGAYFNINAIGGPTTAYYVWYNINNTGVDPQPSGRFGIPVNLTSSETATTIQAKTVSAINLTYFAVPDYRGQTLIGVDKANNYDLGLRFSPYSWIGGLTVGTFELDGVLSHTHTYNQPSVPLLQEGGATPCYTQAPVVPTGYTGNTQTTVYNSAVNYFIHT